LYFTLHYIRTIESGLSNNNFKDRYVFSVVWYYDTVIVIAIAVTFYLVKDVVELVLFYCYCCMVNKDYQNKN